LVAALQFLQLQESRVMGVQVEVNSMA